MRKVADISKETCSKVQAICDEFFALSGLNYFNFVRVFDDGTRICLSNNYEWMQFVFSQALILEEKVQSPIPTYLIWDMIPSIKEDSLMKVASKDFDICHGITLILKYEGYVDFVYYATSSDNEEINIFYVNNLHALNTFLIFFTEQARHIIFEAEQHRLKFDIHAASLDDRNISPIKTYIEAISERASLTDVLRIKRYYLSGRLKNTYLSKREAECLADLFDGLSAREIACKRNISARTAEVHIEHIKLKLECSTKTQMLNKAKMGGFDQIYKAISPINELIYCRLNNNQEKPTLSRVQKESAPR